MSEYRNFNYCVICRSEKNMEAYKGDFEVTMLLNTLYMAVMQPIENRNALHFKSRKIVQWLADNKIIDNQGNGFETDDYVRYLRNGFAHFNINVSSYEEAISKVQITAKNLPEKPLCKEPCGNPKCIPKQLLEQDDSICTFTFSVEQLKDFTNHVIELALDAIPEGTCNACPYKRGV